MRRSKKVAVLGPRALEQKVHANGRGDRVLRAGPLAGDGAVASPRSPWGVVLLIGLLLATDGYDTQAIGYVAPALVAEWNFDRASLGPVFSAGLVGVMIGALSLSALADRVGVRRILLACCAGYGVLSLASAFAGDLQTLTLLRFLTGVALGGAAPNAVALLSEHVPERVRATMLTVAISGFSLGGALGGVVASVAIGGFGWKGVFLFGGLAPLLLLPALIRWLPRPEARPRGSGETPPQTPPRTPIRDLLAGGRRVPTLLLWLMFFMNLLVLYTLSNWLPTLIHADGLSMRTASIATTFYQLAGTVGGLVIARLCDLRAGAPVLAATFLAAAASLWLLGVSDGQLVVTVLAVTACGFFVVGGQNAANAFVGGYYPSGLRATGLGWAHGIGRFGSIAGPLLAGGLFAMGATPATVFKLCAVPAVIAAVSILAVGRLRGAPASPGAPAPHQQPVP